MMRPLKVVLHRERIAKVVCITSKLRMRTRISECAAAQDNLIVYVELARLLELIAYLNLQDYSRL